MSKKDGSELMIRFVQGDDQAFEALLDLYEEETLNYFFRLTRERYTAEDMVQDLFIKIFRYRESYVARSSFRVFLYRIARNMWIDWLRKKKTRPATFPFQAKPSDGDKAPGLPEPDDPRPDVAPPDQVSLKEETARLGRALAHLPEIQREVLVLSFEGGMKYSDISEVLQIPVGTVKSRVHAAMGRLRKLMEEE